MPIQDLRICDRGWVTGENAAQEGHHSMVASNVQLGVKSPIAFRGTEADPTVALDPIPKHVGQEQPEPSASVGLCQTVAAQSKRSSW